MKNLVIILLLFIAFIYILLFTPSSAYCEGCQGCCSHHSGISCDLGADTDGSIICKDGWNDTNCSFIKCCKSE